MNAHAVQVAPRGQVGKPPHCGSEAEDRSVRLILRGNSNDRPQPVFRAARRIALLVLSALLLGISLAASADGYEVIEASGAIEWASGPGTLPQLARSGAVTARALMAYDALPVEVTGLALRLRGQGIDLLAADLDRLQGIQSQVEAGEIMLDPEDKAILERLIRLVEDGAYLDWHLVQTGPAEGLTPDARFRGQGRLVLQGPEGIQVIDRLAEAPLAQSIHEQVLFDGSSLADWSPFAYNGGVLFEENAVLADGALSLFAPDDLGWAKLGIWHSSARLTMPREVDEHRVVLGVDFDSGRDTGISLALHPEEKAGEDPWSGNALRIQLVDLGEGKGRLHANRQKSRVGSSPSRIDFPWPAGAGRLEWVFRPDQVMEVWLAGVRIGHFPLEENLGGQTWVPHVYAQVPGKSRAFQTTVRRVWLLEAPFAEAVDLSLVTQTPLVRTLFDGRTLGPRWALHFSGRGRSIEDVMHWRAGTLSLEWDADNPASLAGLYTVQPFLVLDRFDEQGEAIVDVQLDGATSANFEIAFQSPTIYPGNRPTRGAYVFSVSRAEDGLLDVQAGLAGDKDSPFSVEGLAQLPDQIRFRMTHAGVTAEFDGLHLGPVPFGQIFDGAALRMFVNAVAGDSGPTRLVLKRVDLTRTTRAPLDGPVPAPGVDPLPLSARFDGRMSDDWVGQDLGDAKFAEQFDSLEEGIRLRRRENPPNNNRAALVSAGPIIVLDERLDVGHYRTELLFDPDDPELAVEVLLATNPDSILKSAAYAVTLRKRQDGGLDLGLKADHFSYGIWSRSLPAGWDRLWSGKVSIVLAQGRIDVRLDDDVGLSALTDRARSGRAWHLALRPGVGGQREPGRFTLRSVASGWQGPDGMTKPLRWHLTDPEDFDPAAFVRDLAEQVDMMETAP
ncbi:MAG: hypothetical protein ACP5DC_03850 [Halothiobacillaceae bacterium]